MRAKSFVILIWIASLAAPALAQDGRRPSFRERYGVIAERNIFLKDRRPAEVARAATVQAPAPPPPPVETKFVLVGLVEEGEAYRAHVEDRQNSRFLLLSEGDAVAEGKVAEIDLESIVYEKGDTKVRVAIGNDLRGEPATAATPPAAAAPAPGNAAAATSSSTAPAAGTPPAGGGAEGLSIEERMRRRRAQETNP